jgi:tryptophan synthase beta chain
MKDIKNKLIIVNLSGRGDKDMSQAKELLKFD